MEHIALLFVLSRIKPSSPHTWEQYNRWYNEELAHDILNLPVQYRTRTILRYKNTSPSVDFPYAALYPLKDMRLLHGPVCDRLVAKLRDQSTEAFNGGKAVEHVDFQNTACRLLQTLENRSHTEQEQREDIPITIMTDVCEPPPGPARTSGEAHFRSQYLVPRPFDSCDHYLRSSIYRILVGKVPRYLVIHFFNTELANLPEDLPTAGRDTYIDRQVYCLIFASGEMTYPRVEAPNEEDDNASVDTSDIEYSLPARACLSSAMSTI